MAGRRGGADFLTLLVDSASMEAEGAWACTTDATTISQQQLTLAGL